jgi:DNA-directed RNA polymerase specialized sigma24 family protein
VDRDLVEQARRGDREAFGILARTYGDRLFGIARRILRDVELAEDAVQQALVIAWRELPRLRDPDRFDAWLQRTLVHACYAEDSFTKARSVPDVISRHSALSIGDTVSGSVRCSATPSASYSIARFVREQSDVDLNFAANVKGASG